MADIRDLLWPPGAPRRRRNWTKARAYGAPPRPPGPPRTKARRGPPRSPGRLIESPWLLVILVGAGLGFVGEPWLRERSGPSVASAGSSGTLPATRFGLCHTGGGSNCVVDGDTFYAAGVKIRIADIDTPETHPPRCAEEARLGEAATLRLRELLGAGPFALEPIDKDEDRFGRKLRVVTRDGESLGGVLVSEGLARPYGGGRRPWC